MHNTVLKMGRAAAIAALALSGPAFAAGQVGQTAFQDPVTGRLRNPTAAEAQQLNDLRKADRDARRAAPDAAVAQAPVRQANGAVHAMLGEDSMTYSVMTRNASGELVMQCVTGEDAAQKTLSTPATTPSKEHQHEAE